MAAKSDMSVRNTYVQVESAHGPLVVCFEDAYIDLDDFGDIRPDSLEHRDNVFAHLLGLLRGAALYSLAVLVDWNITGQERETSSLDGVGLWDMLKMCSQTQEIKDF